MDTHEPEQRSRWLPLLARIIVIAIVLTPFIAIIIQAIGKR